MQTPLRLLAAGAIVTGMTLGALPLLPDVASDVPHASAAAVDYFLKIEGIEGESQDERHKNEIDVESFSWGVTGSSTGSGRQGAGKATFQDFHITKTTDKASPILFHSAASGKHYPTAVLTGRKPDGHEFMILKFSDILISSFQQGGGQGSLPTEEVSLNFAKIEFSYIPQDETGKPGSPIVRGWDIKSNK